MKHFTGVTHVRKLVALAGALTLVVALSALPANAQVPVERTAVLLTYQPLGAGTSTFTAGLSYAFGPRWDLLVSTADTTGVGSTFNFGARYHLRPPSREFDAYVSAQSSSTAGVSTILLGGGLTQTLAPGLKGYGTLNYSTDAQVILYDIGVQYDFSRQLSLVAGWNTVGVGYVGVSFEFGR